MKNFFFPALGPEKKEKLQRAGVPFCDFDIGRESGIVVEEEYLQRTLELLGAEVERQDTTEFEGIFKVTLRFSVVTPPPPQTQFAVTVEKWEGGDRTKFVQIATEALLPSVKKNVALSVPHGKSQAPVTDGRFHIFFWSSPDQKKEFNAPAKMWGIPVPCRDSGFGTTGLGIPIMDESGYAVAELIGECLFVHHDAVHHSSADEHRIFRHLCEEVAAELSLTPSQKEVRQRKLVEERRQRSRVAYVTECGKRFEKTLAGTRRAITDGHKKVNQLQEQLVRAVRETAGAERKLEQLESCRGGELQKFEKEFDKLLEVPRVKDVQLADGVVKVFTDTLFCTDPRSRKRHEIGAFRIEINTDGRQDGVRWYNLTRQVDGYKVGMQAPHVFPEGKACLGSTAEVFPQLIGEYEFAAVAMLAIQFVESVNVDDAAGKHINNWPVA